MATTNDNIDIHKLNRIMGHLEDMFENTDMDEEEAQKWFEDMVDEHIPSQHYFYYASWDDSWVADDWAYDVQSVISKGATITATGAYDIGVYNSRVAIVCYDI